MNIIKKLSIGLLLLCVTLPSFAATYTARVSGVMEYSSLSDLRNTLRKAGKGDTVIININSPGGLVDAYLGAVRFINGEYIIAKVHGRADSCAAFLMMRANKRVIDPGSNILFHVGSTGGWRNSIYSPDPELRRNAYEILRIMSPYRRIFSNSEWEAMKEGKDIIVSPNRVRNLNV